MILKVALGKLFLSLNAILLKTTNMQSAVKRSLLFKDDIKY